jgi:hypothetical protein
MQFSVGQNLRTQTAAAFQKLFRARGNGVVHPVTRPAFLCAVKTYFLDFELLANEFIKIDIARYDIPTD